MKTYMQFYTAIIFMLISGFISSQNVKNGLQSSDSFQNQATQLHYLSSELLPITNLEVIAKNVNIEQIGEDNYVDNRLTSQNNDIKLVQVGNRNYIRLDLNAETILENVIQNGTGNIFFDFSWNRSAFHSSEIIQSGYNHSLTLYGNNEISERIKVTMQGNDKSIIIRNFN